MTLNKFEGQTTWRHAINTLYAYKHSNYHILISHTLWQTRLWPIKLSFHYRPTGPQTHYINKLGPFYLFTSLSYSIEVLKERLLFTGHPTNSYIYPQQEPSYCQQSRLHFIGAIIARDNTLLFLSYPQLWHNWISYQLHSKKWLARSHHYEQANNRHVQIKPLRANCAISTWFILVMNPHHYLLIYFRTSFDTTTKFEVATAILLEGECKIYFTATYLHYFTLLQHDIMILQKLRLDFRNHFLSV